jgi:ceroid-lipofuscinosis protein 6
MGASMHLVADSVNHRLRHVGYQNHLSVRDNPVIANLRPAAFVDFFELLYFYDERLGHLMWYFPWFGACVACVWGETAPREPAAGAGAGTGAGAGAGAEPAAAAAPSVPAASLREPLPTHAALALLPLSGLYLWYLGTEGQISQLVVASWLAMELLAVRSRGVGVNGRFLTATFRIAVALIAVWVAWLWADPGLRARYPGLWYVPEPYTWLSLRTAQAAAAQAAAQAAQAAAQV